jgi:hypothetical protein
MRYLLLAVMLISSPAWGAELLVMAKDSCADKLCNRKGDIIQVEADGHDWEGTCKVCTAPNFQIIKLPKVTVEEAKVWMEPLIEEVTETVDDKQIARYVTVRDRKHSFPASVVDSIKFTGKDVLLVEEKNVETYKAQISAKTLSVEKLAIEVANEEIIAK